MTDFEEINRMTLYEYQIRMKAFRLRNLDEEYRIAMGAWMNHQAGATKKKGKNSYEAYFKQFKDFFDYEAKERQILYGEMPDVKKADTPASRYMEYMRGKRE